MLSKWNYIACNLFFFSPCTNGIIYLQFSKSLSPNQQNHLYDCREAYAGNLPSDKNLERRKVPQIELGSDCSERKSQLENISHRDPFEELSKDSRQVHFSFQARSMCCWLLRSMPPARLTHALYINIHTVWDESLWIDRI